MTYWYLIPATLVLLGVAGALYWLSNEGATLGFLDTLCFFGALICILGALCTGAGFVVSNLDRAACMEQGKKTGMNVSYAFLSGCYVHVDDHIVPYDKWVRVSGVNTP